MQTRRNAIVGALAAAVVAVMPRRKAKAEQEDEVRYADDTWRRVDPGGALTEREKVIFDVADRAMRESEPFAYVNAIATIHHTLNRRAGEGVYIPAAYSSWVDCALAEAKSHRTDKQG